MPRKKATQCLGENLRKKRCGLKTTNENGYCYNHQDQFKQKNPKKKVGKTKSEAKKINQGKPDLCPVCYCSMKKEKNSLPGCGHWVHMECIKKSMNPQCPICRHSVKVSKKIKEKMDKKKKEVRESYNNAMIRRHYENSSDVSSSQNINFIRILSRILAQIDSL